MSGQAPASRIDDLLPDQYAAHPDAAALEDATGARWTYADLHGAAHALGDHLRRHDVQSGDRVVIVAENCAAAVAALFAIWGIGAVAVPVNARQTGPEIDKVIAHAQPRAVLFTTHVSHDAASHADKYGSISATGLWGTLGMACPPCNGAASDAEVAVILYTTGTTGAPKGVMLSHGNLRFGAATSATFRGMTARDLIYGVLPMTHVFGLCSIILAAVHAGSAVRLIPRFDVGGGV